jgi:hypothetical protein
VGTSTFASIPDASVVQRLRDRFGNYATFICVEDKSMDTDHTGEFQVIGEMVAVAYDNYFSIAQIPQTVFAMRVSGTHFTFEL